MAGVFDANAVMYDLVDNIRYRINDHLEDIENAFEKDGDKTGTVSLTGILNQFGATFDNSEGNLVDCVIKHPNSDKTYEGSCFAIDTVSGSVVETAQHAFLEALNNAMTSRNAEEVTDLSGKESREAALKSELFDYACKLTRTDLRCAPFWNYGVWWSLDIDTDRKKLNLFAIFEDGNGGTVKQTYTSPVQDGNYGQAVKRLLQRAGENVVEIRNDTNPERCAREEVTTPDVRTELNAYATAKVHSSKELENLAQPEITVYVSLSDSGDTLEVTATKFDLPRLRDLVFSIAESVTGDGPFAALDAALIRANDRIARVSKNGHKQ